MRRATICFRERRQHIISANDPKHYFGEALPALPARAVGVGLAAAGRRKTGGGRATAAVAAPVVAALIEFMKS